MFKQFISRLAPKGRAGGDFIRIEFPKEGSIILYIGRALYYTAGEPQRTQIRRDRSESATLCALIPCPWPLGYKISVQPNTMPRIRMGQDRAIGLGLVPGIYPGFVDDRGVIYWHLGQH